MSFNLSKGEIFDLTKATPGLSNVIAGAGWDVKANGPSMDLDLCAFLLDANGKLVNDKGFVYFNNKTSGCGTVKSSGDNLTGAGDGDDETISVDLNAVPADVARIDIAVSIFNAAQKGQSLKSLENAYVRIVNAADNTEMTKYNLTNFEDANANFILGSLERNDGVWTFKAVGEARSGELGELANSYTKAA